MNNALSSGVSDTTDTDSTPIIVLLPENPRPGESFRIIVITREFFRKTKITVSGPSGDLESLKTGAGGKYPCWHIDDFIAKSPGKYKAAVVAGKKFTGNLEFTVSAQSGTSSSGVVWKTSRSWDSSMEDLYSAWVNALFQNDDENASWSSLHEVTQNKDMNFLYNCLSLGEDDPGGKNSVIMQPDCADNPFFLRAYFAWKLGLPFGYHVCDRGYLGRNPKPGKWITNETSTSKSNPVAAFNNFLRMMKDGVHSGTARAGLEDEKSDYYPVNLEKRSLRPGTVFADPYGHTLILTSWVPQTNGKPGRLLSVDAQPDGTVGIKQFWKGNFLFNTSGVIGEPGFKSFRPIAFEKGVARPLQNKELNEASGYVPFSLQQKKMSAGVFYLTMERLINPDPLDPETALAGLINALHEQLLVRVTSVANGESYFKNHPGTMISMPSSAAAIFQAGGQWEDFSTPNRDLRLLIAMDAVLDFPDRVVASPEDFKMPGSLSPEQVRKKLQSTLSQKVEKLSISYTSSDGTVQNLTIADILKRQKAFEMAYNPNDGIEIRWGAPENSAERSRCLRHAPANQIEKMRSVRTWFSKRLHPPT